MIARTSVSSLAGCDASSAISGSVSVSSSTPGAAPGGTQYAISRLSRNSMLGRQALPKRTVKKRNCTPTMHSGIRLSDRGAARTGGGCALTYPLLRHANGAGKRLAQRRMRPVSDGREEKALLHPRHSRDQRTMADTQGGSGSAPMHAR